jgi:hypothetical protein
VSYTTTVKSTSFTLAPATPTLLLAFQPNRKLLMLAVNNVNPATFKFGSAPASATDGFTLAGASASGGQGGSFLLTDATKPPLHLNNGCCPVDAVYAYSTLGTTVSVQEGTVAAFI